MTQLKKVNKTHKQPSNAAEWLTAMYTHARSSTRVGNKLSHMVQTHTTKSRVKPNLVQLFRKIGARTSTLHIKNMLLADDLMLVSTNRNHPQLPLSMCTNWANERRLQFSLMSFKTVTNVHSTLQPMKLQGKTIFKTDARDHLLQVPRVTHHW